MNSGSDSREESVKKIEALLDPVMLEDLKQALTEVGIQDVTAAVVKNFGSGNAHIERYRGVEYRIEFLPQVKTEFVLSDADCPRALEAIRVVVKRDGLHDVSVTVLPCEEIFCTRTGEIAVAVA
jgi:nitrogen regulatory protein P-II 2